MPQEPISNQTVIDTETAPAETPVQDIVETPDQTTSETPEVIQEDGSPYFSDEEVADLTKKVDEGYEPTETEWEKYRLWNEGRKKEGSTDREGEDPKPEKEDRPTDPLAEALSLVGAKGTDELAGKIKGLLDTMSSSGGKLGEENKNLKKEMEGFHNLVRDLAEGRPEAINFVKEKWGIQPKSQQFSQPEEPEIPADVIDQGTYLIVQKELGGIKAELSELKSAKERAEQAAARERAHNELTDALIGLTAKFPELAPKSGSVGELLREYWSTTSEEPIHPELAPLIDLLNFKKEVGVQNLEDAYYLRGRKEWERQRQEELLNAEKRGYEKATRHAPSVSLAGTRASGGTDVKYSPISDKALQDILDGNAAIPQEWFDEKGELSRERMPKSAWGVAFGG